MHAIHSIFGMPVRFANATRRELLARLGKLPQPKSRGAPELTIEFVPSLRGFRKRGFSESSPERILGVGFALDCPLRTLYYPLDARLRYDVSERQGSHYLLARTIALSIALLNESDEKSMSRRAILYLHASAVATSRGALLFCGESTFGKSTISEKLLTPFLKLEDDQVFIRLAPKARRSNPEVLIFPRSRIASRLKRDSVPVAGIFWLKKSPLFAIEPMDRSIMASKIIQPIINWPHPLAAVRRLGLLRALLAHVRCGELSFARESKPLIAMLKAHKFI
jgi:hypothetical protein